MTILESSSANYSMINQSIVFSKTELPLKCALALEVIDGVMSLIEKALWEVVRYKKWEEQWRACRLLVERGLAGTGESVLEPVLNVDRFINGC